MRIELIKNTEKKKIIEKIEENFGISHLPYLLIRFGSDIYAYSGIFSKEELSKMNNEIRIESIGLHLLREEKDGILLSFDAINLLNPTKNIIDLSDKQAEDWLTGKDIEYTSSETASRFIILKNKNNLIGCGKYSNNRISNLMPRERRIKP
ncbi:hypothetical protein HYW76_00290 [Candidatus Pacearchaeota archaeon]|nr:hypothetical protein [Candidatus Pacearchaeota archaeon]